MIFYVDNTEASLNDKSSDLLNYAREHIGVFYVLAETFSELEEFLVKNATKLPPVWKTWNLFPETWNHDDLLKAFWESESRDEFCFMLQREGNTSLLQWIFTLAKEKYGIEQFDPSLVSVYIDIVHMSGDYAGAVEIENRYFQLSRLQL